MSDFSDSVEDFVESFFRGRLHTAQPGEIVKVISTSPPIVNVQPAFMRLREGSEEPEKRPVIPNVPVIFPVFGDFGIVGPIEEGMTVLLIAAERSIKPWMEQGGVVDPKIDRIFDLSDCVAIPGLPNKNTAWAVPDEGLQIGKVDGSTSIKITDGEIVVDSGDLAVTVNTETVVGSGTDFVALAQKVEDKIRAIVDAITNAAVGSMDGGAAFKAAIIAALNISLPAIGSVASQKLKTE